MPSPTVLVVEDELLIRMDLADILSNAGFQVLEASKASEALIHLEQDKDIALLITDIDMPGSMDGLALAFAVANRWPPIRIIVVSGQRRPSRDKLPAGGLFLEKPYSSAQIESAVSTLFN